jgi:hypothetical protein
VEQEVAWHIVGNFPFANTTMKVIAALALAFSTTS